MRWTRKRYAALGVATTLALAAVVCSLNALAAQGQSLALADTQEGDGAWRRAMAAHTGAAAPSRDDEAVGAMVAADRARAAEDEVRMSIQPTRSVVAPGEIFTVEVAVENAPEIIGYSLNMSWNAAVFSVTTVADVAFADLADRLLPLLDADNQQGTLIFEVFLFPSTEPPTYPPELPSGDGTLALITLQAKGVGTSTLDLDATGVFTRSGGQIRIPDPGDGVAEARRDAVGFRFGAIGDQVAGEPFTVTTTAVDEHGVRVEAFSGTVALSDTTGTLMPTAVALEAGTGAVTRPVTITQAATGITLVAEGVNAAGQPILGESDPFTVTHTMAVSVAIAPDRETVTAGDCLTYTLGAEDVYGNPWDVTEEATFDSEDEAQGTWAGNRYCSEVAGSWQVTGTYEALSDTAELTVEPGELARIPVTPAAVTLQPQETQPFAAAGFDAFDNAVAITPIWSVADPDAGSISEATGIFTAGTVPGQYLGAVVAAAQGVTGTADVTILEGELARIAVTPAAVTLPPGGTQPFAVACYDAFDNEIPCSVAWSVAADAGSIDATGVFTAGTASGSYPGAVVAAAGGVTGTADVTVEPGELVRVDVSPSEVTLQPQQTRSFTATCYDAFDNEVSCTPVWIVTDPDAGSIDDVTGVFTAGTAAGSYPGAVVAVAGGVTGMADVTVGPGELDRVEVSPSGVTLQPEETQLFTATGYDAFDNEVTILPSWSVAYAEAGSIGQATGVFTAGTVPGEYLGAVVAAADGVTGTADVTVTEGELDRLEVSPSAVTLAPQEAQLFTVTCYDAFDNEIMCSVAWSANAEAGSIAATGLFTAGTTAGSYPGAVVAAAGGVTETADVTVTTGALGLIEVSPPTVTLMPEETQAFTATCSDAFGNEVVCAPSWSVADADAGSIAEATGVFTAGTVPGAYPGTVVAAAEGVTGTADVTVTVGALDRIAVSPPAVTLKPSDTQVFTATCYDAYDNQVACTPAWTVADADAGTIDATTGLFTADRPGDYPDAVVAAAETVTGTANVTVEPFLVFMPMSLKDVSP